MFPKILTQIFGSRNDRLLKGYRKTVQLINALEPKFEGLDNDALRAKTDEFRDRVAKSGHREAWQYFKNGHLERVTWLETQERVYAMAAGLMSLGLHLEDRVAIAST